jgi:hypothetical protein
MKRFRLLSFLFFIHSALGSNYDYETKNLRIKKIHTLEDMLLLEEHIDPESLFFKKEIQEKAKQGFFSLSHQTIFGTYAIYEKESEKFIGHFNLDTPSQSSKKTFGSPNLAEKSTYFLKNYTGKGYGFEYTNFFLKELISPNIGKKLNIPVLSLLGRYKLEKMETSFDGVISTIIHGNYPSLSMNLKAGLSLRNYSLYQVQLTYPPLNIFDEEANNTVKNIFKNDSLTPLPQIAESLLKEKNPLLFFSSCLFLFHNDQVETVSSALKDQEDVRGMIENLLSKTQRLPTYDNFFVDLITMLTELNYADEAMMILERDSN